MPLDFDRRRRLLHLALASDKHGRAWPPGQRPRPQEEGSRQRKLEARAYAALGELLDSGSATARTQAVRYTLDRLTANSPACLEAAKKALWLDMQEQTKQQMPAARAKLARLIESRAHRAGRGDVRGAKASRPRGREGGTRALRRLAGVRRCRPYPCAAIHPGGPPRRHPLSVS